MGGPGCPPRTSLNRPIGQDRILAIVRSRLDAVKGVAHTHDATVNDVLLTAVAGGLRTLLASRGEPVGGLVLRAFVPVSLHREQPGQARGNLDEGMIVPLPEAFDDRRGYRRAEEEEPPTGQHAVPERGDPAGVPAARGPAAADEHLRRQRARAAGPAVPGRGSPARGVPIVPIMGNVPLGIGALSYAGQFNITVVADRDGCPDAAVFTEGLQAALDALTQAAPVPS